LRSLSEIQDFVMGVKNLPACGPAAGSAGVYGFAIGDFDTRGARCQYGVDRRAKFHMTVFARIRRLGQTPAQ
jgi:hypothetical protein